MSAATDALLARLFAEGALPAAPFPLQAGEVVVAGTWLSRGVAELYRVERARWMRRKSPPGAWLTLVEELLPPDTSASDLRSDLRRLFGLSRVRAPRAARYNAAPRRC